MGFKETGLTWGRDKLLRFSKTNLGRGIIGTSLGLDNLRPQDTTNLDNLRTPHKPIPENPGSTRI